MSYSTVLRKLFRNIYASVFLIVSLTACSCSKKSGGGEPVNPPVNPPVTPPAVASDITTYLTQPDQFVYFKKQSTAVNFTNAAASYPAIDVDSSQAYQTIDGFGFTLTGGSASLIHSLAPAEQTALLKDLFLWDSTHIGISYLRISIGASDLSAFPFTYDDITSGTDFPLAHFTLEQEQRDLLPVLKQIVQLNPQIKILGSPWTAPAWMKTNNDFKGGSLKPDCYEVYAKYLVKYIQAMKAEGITIDAITPQNEPLHGGNNPSMVMQATEQADFIKNHLGPAFAANGLSTKIIVYDHNADRPDYPMTILGDAAAAKYVDGSAFHLYGGSINALSQVHDAFPNKSIYFTEQWVGGPGNFASDLKWHVENLIIGATRNWSRNVLEWNLAADPNYLPHTNGGCTNCLGALTVGSSVAKNVSYYIIAHASKFVRPGSQRIASSIVGSLVNVAFKTPDGKKVLIVLNKGTNGETFSLRYKERTATLTLAAGAVATYVW